MQNIVSFWSYAISEGILRNQKIIIGLDKFSNQRFKHLVCLDNTIVCILLKKVQVGKDQEKAQSEKDSHSKNRDGKKIN